MSRKSRLKISKIELKELLLEMYIDENGKKVSDRKVFSNPEFMEITGLHKINRVSGEKEPISTGSISDWKRRLELNEIEVFKYHKNKTGRILPEVNFDEWSKYKNKGGQHQKGNTTIFDSETIKRKMALYFGLSKSMLFYDLKVLEEVIIETDGKEEVIEFYNKLKGGEI